MRNPLTTKKYQRHNSTPNWIRGPLTVRTTYILAVFDLRTSRRKEHACLARDSILLLLLGYPRPPMSDRRVQAPPLASCLRWFWTTPSVDAWSRRRDVLPLSRLVHVATGTTWSAAQSSRDMSMVRTSQKTLVIVVKLHSGTVNRSRP